MSASRDKSQKIGFVFANLYQIYRKEKEGAQTLIQNAKDEAKQAQNIAQPKPLAPLGLTTSRIIKAGTQAANSVSPFATVRVRSFTPAELLAKRISAKSAEARAEAPTVQQSPAPEPATIAAVLAAANAMKDRANRMSVQSSQNEAIDSLKKNLNSLTDLHSRLKFMLKELEDLVKNED
jgi:hypothetical protein